MRSTDMYETDFLCWLEQQAALLRARQFIQLDCQHLIEELEEMGREQKVALQSLLRQLLIHLLKLQFSPATWPQLHWLEEITEWRDQVQTRMEMTPSLQHDANELLEKAWIQARRSVEKSLIAHGETAAIPRVCPYTLAQILDHDFLPISDLD
ncbi:DUF29 domain-containing protein [Rhodoferax sp. 4810]|uniref:DUF29 domain-containing protein n=1 Tax=Thiospirillum jenense TaxID=1653858 RepID=A0A839H2I9_9GAMM|nr:DUF29 domain-containing protein [Thiospirillum jenense]MBB1073124.1 DUF29 domain-containing protein [Rhodoferax jenense]MBB1124715.1 DUF29 domain-containing protein [Thiospirillum jenense]